MFIDGRIVFPVTATPQVISPPPPTPAISPVWGIGVTATSLPNGTVRLDLTLPGAGTVRAHGTAFVAVTVHASRVKAHRSSTRARTRVLAVQVTPTAQASEPQTSGVASVILALSPAYRSLASRTGGLSATAAVAFQAPGHATVTQTIAVTFAGRAPAKVSKHKKAAATRHAKKRSRA